MPPGVRSLVLAVKYQGWGDPQASSSLRGRQTFQLLETSNTVWMRGWLAGSQDSHGWMLCLH